MRCEPQQLLACWAKLVHRILVQEAMKAGWENRDERQDTKLHLKRRAYVYVRQSTATQVFANTESTARQYALVERARALGWPEDAVDVIDEDLGRSGATATGEA